MFTALFITTASASAAEENVCHAQSVLERGEAMKIRNTIRAIYGDHIRRREVVVHVVITSRHNHAITGVTKRRQTHVIYHIRVVIQRCDN